MGTLLVFHLLGLYPVPSTSQFLILSPFTPKYTIHNSYLNVSTTVTVAGFNATSVQKTIPAGAAAYVKSVTFNNVTSPNRCHLLRLLISNRTAMMRTRSTNRTMMSNAFVIPRSSVEAYVTWWNTVAKAVNTTNGNRSISYRTA